MKVAVTWQMCGFVDIDEDSMEKCMKKFEETSDKILNSVFLIFE